MTTEIPIARRTLEATIGRQPARLLMVDDDVPWRTLARRLLARDPHLEWTVTAVASAAEALATPDLRRFDCLLIDYRLPDGTGTELVERLRDKLRTRLPPVVVISAGGGEDAAMHAVRAHATDYLAKRALTPDALYRSLGNAVEKGELRATVRSRRDELRRANGELERRAVEIQRFYHTVSHEMKTPLTAAREFVAIVRDGLAGDLNAEQTSLLEHALESCDQITRQFDDLIDLTRLETGKLRLDFAPARIDRTVERCLAMVASAAAARDIELVCELEPELPAVTMDAGRIGQVLVNLVGNAIKFTDPGGRVVLSARAHRDGKRLRLRVLDTGRGIAKADRARIFERLYQVDRAVDDPAASGLGLGLSISREIVRGHGHELRLYSRVGLGSTFGFDLPVATTPTAPRSGASSPAKVPQENTPS